MATSEILWRLEISADLATVTEMPILTILTGVIIEQANAWNVWETLQAGNATDASMAIMEIHYQGSVKVLLVLIIIRVSNEFNRSLRQF